jgi:hypothetical protein
MHRNELSSGFNSLRTEPLKHGNPDTPTSWPIGERTAQKWKFWKVRVLKLYELLWRARNDTGLNNFDIDWLIINELEWNELGKSGNNDWLEEA